jgi:ribose-phosphate pyrophosphokinase
MPRERVVFSTRSYGYLADGLAAAAGLPRGAVSCRFFPDGERHLVVATPVARREVVIVGGTVSDADTLEVFDLACGVVALGAESLLLVIPYFGYSTMERVTQDGEVVTAKTRARLLSAIPRARTGNRVILLDAHSEGLPHYFEGGLTSLHLRADPVILRAARKIGIANSVLACADAGRAKRVQSLANALGVPAGFVFKKRLDAETTELIAMSADVEGKPVILYDDMIRTGSSLRNAAAAYLRAGAASVTALATHGVLPGDALQRLRESGLLQGVVCTDSHPRAVARADAFLSVEPIAPLLAEALLSDD